MITLEKKIRVDCKAFAPCGKVSRASCYRYKGKLDICVGCNLVKRYNKRGGIVVNGVLMRKCSSCGNTFPAHRFYPRTIRHPNGKTYHTRECVCVYCKNRKSKERIMALRMRASPAVKTKITTSQTIKSESND